MRDYLYIWHDPLHQFLVASGIEFKDFVPALRDRGGVLLIEGESEIAGYDADSGFNSVDQLRLGHLVKENIYSWGNFVWADYPAPGVPKIGDEGTAEILFFAHRGRPLNAPQIPDLQNRFLAYAHDDGWYLKLYYSNWSAVADLLASSVQPEVGILDVVSLKEGTSGYWLKGGVERVEEKTHDIDSILNRNL